MSGFELSDDRSRLDVDRIHDWLANSYWSPGIARETVERAIANSHCLGGYRDGRQVCFARMITDRGGIPTHVDRILGSRFGVAAIDAASAGQSDVMTALRGETVEMVPLSEVAGKVKHVPDELLAVARALA